MRIGGNKVVFGREYDKSHIVIINYVWKYIIIVSVQIQSVRSSLAQSMIMNVKVSVEYGIGD